MKLCVAQTRPIRGDINANIDRHRKLIDIAITHHTDMIVFPELSLTGYEPTLARDLAMDPNDPCLDVFQTISTSGGITIGVGAPTRGEPLPRISLVLFSPGEARQVYSKRYLHADEEPYFTPGSEHDGIIAGVPKIALAICYELSVPAHAAHAAKNNAKIYLVSTAKTATGVANAHERLAEIARTHSMTVLMCNCLGECDGVLCTGSSAAWNNHGELLDKLDDANEALLIFDTKKQRTFSIPTP